MISRQVANRERRQREENSKKINESTLHVPYREAIGSLLYLAGSTRPDIAFAVNLLSRHQINPTESEWKMVARIFRYLKGTKSLGLKNMGRQEGLLAYSDASFADCKSSVSTCGFVIKLYGDTIAWQVNKQSYVALSTCEAEYVAMNQACQEIIAIISP